MASIETAFTSKPPKRKPPNKTKRRSKHVAIGFLQFGRHEGTAITTFVLHTTQVHRAIMPPFQQNLQEMLSSQSYTHPETNVTQLSCTVPRKSPHKHYRTRSHYHKPLNPSPECQRSAAICAMASITTAFTSKYPKSTTTCVPNTSRLVVCILEDLKGRPSRLEGKAQLTRPRAIMPVVPSAKLARHTELRNPHRNKQNTTSTVLPDLDSQISEQLAAAPISHQNA